MIITMLYFSTIGKLVEEHGFSWLDAQAIEDHDERVKCHSLTADGQDHTSSLEHMFYVSHMCGWDTYHYKQNIIDAFVEALEEAKAKRMQEGSRNG